MNRCGTLENNSSIDNYSGGTIENNSSVENKSGGTLENTQLVLYVCGFLNSTFALCQMTNQFEFNIFNQVLR